MAASSGKFRIVSAWTAGSALVYGVLAFIAFAGGTRVFFGASAAVAKSSDPNQFGVSMLASAGALTLLILGFIFATISFFLIALCRKARRKQRLRLFEWTLLGISNGLALLLASTVAGAIVG